jgi:putative oxidoreductase
MEKLLKNNFFMGVNHKRNLLATGNSLAPTILRFFLGVVVFPHGAQKLLGWFNGYGFAGSMQYFTQTVRLPWIIGFTVILLEFFGALALIVGIGTRVFAILYLALALGITLLTRLEFGFFMNWFGNQKGEGYEYFLFWIAIALALLITGAGKYSVDRFLVKENK